MSRISETAARFAASPRRRLPSLPPSAARASASRRSQSLIVVRPHVTQAYGAFRPEGELYEWVEPMYG